MFRAQASSSAFGTPSSTPAFVTPSSTLAFGTPSSTPAFATPTYAPAFGTPTTPSFATGLGSSLFATPFSSQPQQQQQQQLQTPSFQKPASAGFGFQTTPFAKPQPSTFPNAQSTTLMAPVAPLPFSLSDRDVQAIVDAYKDEPGNPKYAFKHLLFSVTDPQFRVKPAGVSDIMWTEAMGKLEGLDRADRDRLWPQLVQGFKDLSQRLKVMRIVEALEGKGFRLPLIKGEAELAEKLAAITRQVLQQQTEAIAGLGNILKRDVRDMKIIMAADREPTEDLS